MAEAQGAAGAAGGGEIVRLLEAAMAPIEPPARLADELELRLAEVQAAALEELHDWEIRAMRDPRLGPTSSDPTPSPSRRERPLPRPSRSSRTRQRSASSR